MKHMTLHFLTPLQPALVLYPYLSHCLQGCFIFNRWKHVKTHAFLQFVFRLQGGPLPVTRWDTSVIGACYAHMTFCLVVSAVFAMVPALKLTYILEVSDDNSIEYVCMHVDKDDQ